MTGRPWRLPATSPAWCELVAAIIDGAPPLRLALCRRAPPQMFDGATDRDRSEAIRICRRCPEIQQCRQWLTALPPSRRPTGVTAARYRR